jgi:hypothetical protein
MSAETKCLSWLGHKFQPRYSKSPPPDGVLDGIKTNVYGGEMILKAYTGETYEGDICVRCGAVVNKRQPTT